MRRLVFAGAVLALLPILHVYAYTVTVVDSSNQTIKMTNAKAAPGGEYLSIDAGLWDFDIHFSQIKQIKALPKRPEDQNTSSVPFQVTLSGGTTVQGQVNVGFKGGTDFGAAEVTAGKILSATFEKDEADEAFKPSTDEPIAAVVDTKGGKFTLSYARFEKSSGSGSGLSWQTTANIAGMRGEITLAIPVVDIKQIENIGKARPESGKSAKWHVVLFSGKETELSVGTDYRLKGDYENGIATISRDNIQSVTFQKKKE